MSKLSSNTAIHSPQQPLALMARVIDSLGIGMALYLATLLATTDDGWSRIHAFYALVAMLLMQFYSEFFHVYQTWKIDNNSLSRLWMLSISGLTWTVTCLTLLAIALLFDQSARLLDWHLASYWFGLALVIFALIRATMNKIIRLSRRNGINVRKVAIAGAGPLGRYLSENLHNNPWVGYDIVGVFDDRSQKVQQMELLLNKRKRESIDKRESGLAVDGNFQDLLDAAAEREFDTIFITLPMRAEHKTQEIIRKLASRSTVAVYVIPDFYTASFRAHFTHLVDINGLPAVSIFENPVSGLRSIVKRVEDIVLSLIILILIAIPMALIAIAVKLTSRGPIIFKQKRYGLNGEIINVWKFRSMTVTEDGANEFVQATKQDVRITRLGHILRKYSLDELPQFFNVLSGSMSIVGPRPHAVAHNELFRSTIRGYMLRHKTKPGITGWAQVNGYRGETDVLQKMQNRIDYDLDYIRQWSLFFDLRIIFLTIFKGFTGKHVY
ncbi:MAG TPA: undecaprenyl-phosphate glucose phosphotransferase [Gammaproteobacteria bacterium]|jgi:putative colanic acid biosynthesis UDP-glucose lipid carrier transferase|nr:undecaprenyl-phosphate glucose phosphotransferase [Gammaproteobacteria bacterium]